MAGLMNLEINNFRAVQSANIELNGITVVAGVNGSGKSTLSKVLYNTLKASKNYDKLIKNSLNKELDPIVRALNNINREIRTSIIRSHIVNDRLSNRQARTSLRIFENEELDEYFSRFTYTMDTLEKNLFSILQDNRLGKNRYHLVQRYIKLLNGIVHDDVIYSTLIDDVEQKLHPSFLDDYFEKERKVGEDNNFIENFYDEDIHNLIGYLKTKVFKSILKATEGIENRPLKIFINSINESFYPDYIHNREFTLYELGIPIVDWENETLRSANLFQDCVYIDTPMSIGYEGFDNVYWDDLNITLNEKKSFFSDSILDIDALISSKDIIGGEVYSDDNFDGPLNGDLRYKRMDGMSLDLDECATGIKSFGIIQMLLKNGHLNKNMLLIIDEPEAHLHPQWIVEYARIIVLLNKYLGVNFFIASHNPDMISAIRAIAEKEGTLDKVNYYLARESTDQPYKYVYDALESDIEPIFESFNIALERIYQYGKNDPD